MRSSFVDKKNPTKILEAKKPILEQNPGSVLHFAWKESNSASIFTFSRERTIPFANGSKVIPSCFGVSNSKKINDHFVPSQICLSEDIMTKRQNNYSVEAGSLVIFGL